MLAPPRGVIQAIFGKMRCKNFLVIVIYYFQLNLIFEYYRALERPNHTAHLEYTKPEVLKFF